MASFERAKPDSILPKIDARDFALWLGLALLALGLFLVWPPAAAIVPGAILVGMAIFGVRG